MKAKRWVLALFDTERVDYIQTRLGGGPPPPPFILTGRKEGRYILTGRNAFRLTGQNLSTPYPTANRLTGQNVSILTDWSEWLQ
jgi:hypothetical protein